METVALVLVGGKSRRMNGNNKAFLKFKNKSFIENITDELKNFNNIYLSVDDKEKYKHLNYILLEDIYKDIGPIGGIYSALKVIDEKYIFVTACDMPKITKEFIEFLFSSITEDVKCVVVQDEEGRIYPLGGIYSKDILYDIEDMIQKKDYKLLNLINRVKSKIISLPDTKFNKDILNNINNLEQYNELKNLEN